MRIKGCCVLPAGKVGSCSPIVGPRSPPALKKPSLRDDELSSDPAGAGPGPEHDCLATPLSTLVVTGWRRRGGYRLETPRRGGSTCVSSSCSCACFSERILSPFGWRLPRRDVHFFLPVPVWGLPLPLTPLEMALNNPNGRTYCTILQLWLPSFQAYYHYHIC